MMIAPPNGDPFLSYETPTAPVVSRSLIQRFNDDEHARSIISRMERGETIEDGDLYAALTRGITSATSALPVRENLDAEVHILSPVETPLRNMLPRVPGAGLSAQWRVLSGFGAGLATQTTTSGATNTANTLTVTNARGFFAGESIIWKGTTTLSITSINYSTNVISVASGVGLNAQTNGESVVKADYFYPISETAAQIFYAESGTAEERTSTYTNVSKSYKLLGKKGSVTQFAMAAGDNFQNQYETEKRNTLIAALLAEEYALLHSDSSVTAKPFGDGSTALGYDGLIPWITANAPSAQVQSSVGTLTFAHIQQQLTRVHYNGGRGKYILLNGAQAEKLLSLAETGGVYRAIVGTDGNWKLGGKVASIYDSVSGEEVPLIVHPYMPKGWMVFGSNRNAEGQNVADVSALPQVSSPDMAGASPFGGYYAQELAPASTAHDVLPFVVKCYSVPRWKNTKVFGLSTGIS